MCSPLSCVPVGTGTSPTAPTAGSLSVVAAGHQCARAFHSVCCKCTSQAGAARDVQECSGGDTNSSEVSQVG